MNPFKEPTDSYHQEVLSTCKKHMISSDNMEVSVLPMKYKQDSEEQELTIGDSKIRELNQI